MRMRTRTGTPNATRGVLDAAGEVRGEFDYFFVSNLPSCREPEISDAHSFARFWRTTNHSPSCIQVAGAPTWGRAGYHATLKCVEPGCAATFRRF